MALVAASLCPLALPGLPSATLWSPSWLLCKVQSSQPTLGPLIATPLSSLTILTPPAPGPLPRPLPPVRGLASVLRGPCMETEGPVCSLVLGTPEDHSLLPSVHTFDMDLFQSSCCSAEQKMGVTVSSEAQAFTGSKGQS